MRVKNLVGEPQKNETGRRGHLERMAVQRGQQKDVVPPVGKVPVVDALKPLTFVDEDKLKKVVLMGPLHPLHCFFDGEFKGGVRLLYLHNSGMVKRFIYQ
jgi:hypothetical protein